MDDRPQAPAATTPTEVPDMVPVTVLLPPADVAALDRLMAMHVLGGGKNRSRSHLARAILTRWLDGADAARVAEVLGVVIGVDHGEGA